MGKPHGMILDFYMKELTTGSGNQELKLTSGVEIDSNTLRLSGPANFNAPSSSNRAECVKNLDLNFKSIDYKNFNKDIQTDPEKFASAKLSQTFTNWFIAVLWNDGFFCSKKEFPVGDNPPFIPESPQLTIKNIDYTLTPLTPPYIDYTTLEDTNQDDIIDISNDLVSKGTARINLIISYTTEDQLDSKESITIDFSYILPFTLEEPDITLSQEEGFTFAKSFFRSDVENTRIDISQISCSPGLICDVINSPFYKESLMQEIKENIASHLDRGIT